MRLKKFLLSALAIVMSVALVIVPASAGDSSGPYWWSGGYSTPWYYKPDAKTNYALHWDSDAGIDRAWIFAESNYSGAPTNYTMQLFSGTWYYHEDVLPAGTFYWKSYAKDKNGIWNSTHKSVFSISKAAGNVAMKLNGNTGESFTISYGDEFSLEAVSNSSIVLYMNGIMASNPYNGTPNSGYYVYFANASENQNYTYANATAYVTVEKAYNPITITADGVEGNLTFKYGDSVNITASGVGVELYRNDIRIEKSEVFVPSPGDYSFVANSSGNENYMANSTSLHVNVEKADNEISLQLSNNSTQVYLIGSSSVGKLELYKDGTLLAVDEGMIYVPDEVEYNTVYNYTLVATGTRNHHSNSTSVYFYIEEPPGNDTDQTNSTNVTDNITEEIRPPAPPQPSGGGGGGGAVYHPPKSQPKNESNVINVTTPVDVTKVEEPEVEVPENKIEEPEEEKNSFDGTGIGLMASAVLMGVAAMPDPRLRKILNNKKKKPKKKPKAEEPEEKPKVIDLMNIIAETKRTYMLFPLGREERIAVQMNIAKRIQAEQGNFYPAQVLSVLKAVYPHEASKMEEQIAKEISDWIRNSKVVPDKKIANIEFYRLVE